METVCIAVLLAVLIGVVVYQIRIDGITRRELFKVQIEMAQAQQATTKDLSWADIKKIIDEIINYTVNTYIRINGLNKLSNEELSLVWVLALNELCVTVDQSISDEIKRQALKNVTEDYFMRYVKNSIEVVIVYTLETNKDNKVNDRLTLIQRGKQKENTKK